MICWFWTQGLCGVAHTWRGKSLKVSRYVGKDHKNIFMYWWASDLMLKFKAYNNQLLNRIDAAVTR